jgi:heme export protein D (CcmD)
VNPWPFVIAAYALTLAGTAGLGWWSYRAMRRAEKAADELSRRP